MKEEHKCQYCGAWTLQPDHDCYKNPKFKKLSEEIKITELFDKYYEYVYTTDDGEQRGEWKRDFARQIIAQFKPVPLPDDLKKWIEDEAEKYSKEITSSIPSITASYKINLLLRRAVTYGANLLSPQIEEQRKEIERLSYKLAEFSKEIQRLTEVNIQLNKDVFNTEANNEQLQFTLAEQEKEIERLSGLIDAIGVVVKNDRKEILYWKERCEAAEYLVSCVDVNINKKFIGYKEWQELKNSEPNDKRSVATEDDGSNGAGKIKALEQELEITDKLLNERQKVIDAIPECPLHGANCVPHALDWIRDVQSKISSLESQLAEQKSK